uniref:Uncharacterized protein n=1 Tax=Arundo donax TaxID=35708 RepID=A0A0A9U9V7_ARUDO
MFCKSIPQKTWTQAVVYLIECSFPGMMCSSFIN